MLLSGPAGLSASADSGSLLGNSGPRFRHCSNPASVYHSTIPATPALTRKRVRPKPNNNQTTEGPGKRPRPMQLVSCHNGVLRTLSVRSLQVARASGPCLLAED